MTLLHESHPENNRMKGLAHFLSGDQRRLLEGRFIW